MTDAEILAVMQAAVVVGLSDGDEHWDTSEGTFDEVCVGMIRGELEKLEGDE